MITEDRIWEIVNGVSEEFTDLGTTSFATKKELCEVIRELAIKNSALESEKQSSYMDYVMKKFNEAMKKAQELNV